MWDVSFGKITMMTMRQVSWRGGRLDAGGLDESEWAIPRGAPLEKNKSLGD